MAQTLEASDLKELTHLNLNQLELAINELLVEQLGGHFSVHVARFSQFNASNAALEIDLRIFDQDKDERPDARNLRALKGFPL